MTISDKITNSIYKRLYNTFIKFSKFKEKGMYPDYKALLTEFSKSMGFNLIVNPDEEKHIGEANGKDIFIYEEWGMNTFYFAYFHELGHNLLHFRNGKIVKKDIKLIEMEADVFATFFCINLFPNHSDLFLQIGRNNPVYN